MLARLARVSRSRNRRALSICDNRSSSVLHVASVDRAVPELVGDAEPAAGADGHWLRRRRRPEPRRFVLQGIVRREQQPAVADQHQHGPRFAQRRQIEIVRSSRLVSVRSSRRRSISTRSRRRVAPLSRTIQSLPFGVSAKHCVSASSTGSVGIMGHRMALAPWPVARELFFNRHQAPPQHQVTRLDVLRHDAEEVVGGDDAIERVDQGRPDGVRSLDAHVQRVQVHDEDAVVRVGGLLERFALVVRIDPFALRQARLDADELEVLDLLRLAVLEDLEVGRRQPFDGAPVLLRIGIDGHEHGARAKRGRALLSAPPRSSTPLRRRRTAAEPIRMARRVIPSSWQAWLGQCNPRTRTRRENPRPRRRS